jgi:hypothetical protein
MEPHKKKPDPDPHETEKSDPDTNQRDGAPQHCNELCHNNIRLIRKTNKMHFPADRWRWESCTLLIARAILFLFAVVPVQT